MQIFHRSTNTLSRATIFGAVFVLAGVSWALLELQGSPYITYAGVVKPQPVAFSHQHHVTGLGIDCRYCHTSVEQSSFAGIPPAKTCMNCHSQIWTNAQMLEPVRASYRSGESLQWTRVNQLPDYVYFNHSIHISKGVGCNREPQKYLRPRDQVFNMRYAEPSSARPVEFDGQSFTDQESLGSALVAKYQLRTAKEITNCSTCHR